MEELCAGIKFMNKEHKDFFCRNLLKCRELDIYHMALIYCLGIDRTVRADPDGISAGGMADLGKQACNQTGIQSVYQRYSQCR